MKVIDCCWLHERGAGMWPQRYEDPEIPTLPGLRRLTPLGRKVLQHMQSTSCSLDGKAMPWIIASRDGESRHKVDLLVDLSNGNLLSPTDFSMSVHNAIAGIYSIASGNTEPYTTVAAGSRTFEMGLLETIAHQQEKGGVVGYIYYDYLSRPADVGEKHDESKVCCFAMLLGPGSEGVTVKYVLGSHLEENSFNMALLEDFFNNDTQRYVISIPGGKILFERIPADC